MFLKARAAWKIIFARRSRKKLALTNSVPTKEMVQRVVLGHVRLVRAVFLMEHVNI
jgi:hypothetical protein